MTIIDVSEHNGNLNWEKMKRGGIDGVIIRAGYGWEFHEDDMFRKNVREAEARGIPYGLYLYSYATNVNQAQTEVKQFLEAISGMKPTLPVVIDTEDADGWRETHGNPSWQLLAEMLECQLKEIEKAGYYAMWYSNLYWADNLIDARASLRNYDLWFAQWGVSEPDMSCGIWQYTSDGDQYGDGIERSDLNISYKDYPAIIKEAGLNGWGGAPEAAVSSAQAHQPEMLEEDGYLGPKTITALQCYLGTPVDGVISEPSLCIKELQRRLNAGRI